MFNLELKVYETSHKPALDGLRGFAILLVIVFHCYRFLNVTSIGWIGVDLFFVLSGFLITGILLKSKGAPNYFKNFIARRTLRIFPLYYLALILFLVVMPALFPMVLNAGDELMQYQGWYWLYGQNILYVRQDGFLWGDRDNILNHFWSLSVEEHFYLVWPWIVYFFSGKKLLRLSIVLIIASVVSRIFVVTSEISWVVPYVFTLTRMDSLILGGVLAMLFTNPESVKWLQRNFKVIFFGSLGLAGIFIALTRQLSSFHVQSNSYGLFFLVIAIFFASLLILVLSENENWAKKIFSSKPMMWLGKYSYGLYVFHLPIYLLLIRYAFDPIHHAIKVKIVSDLTVATIAIAITVMVSLISFHLYESKFLKFKKYF